jgi:cell division inhibitor SepF
MGEYLGLVEQADFEDEYFEPEPPVPEPPRVPAVRPAKVASIEENRHEFRRPREARPSPLSRIETVTPRTYNDARLIGENFREGVPVIMNISEISDSDARRLVDFAAGLVFSVHGSLNRVHAKVFLLSPENVHVSDEDRQRITAGGFYDHG